MEEKTINYLQIRGDRDCVQLKLRVSEAEGDKRPSEPTFEVVKEQPSSWIANNSAEGISFSALRKGIEPWLTS
jgi:hypothetical protein